jgi:hypothetical protein
VLLQLLLLLGALLGAVSLLPLPSRAAPAEAFVSREGRFAAAFPAEPVRERSGRDTWAGWMEEGSYDLEGPGLRLRVEFHDVPRMATLVLPSAMILELAKQGVLDDMRARAASEQRVSLHGHPGLALSYVPGERPDTTEQTRLFLVGSRLYVAFASADQPGEPQEAAVRFLASFDAWESGDAVATLAGSASGGM